MKQRALAELTETWPLAKIKPYEQNPRTHSEKQVALLAELMKKYGIDQPIVVDEKGVILKGHGRRLAAIQAGFKTFPVVKHKGLSADDKQAIRIADNQVAILAGWDDELLKIEVDGLRANGFDVGMLGFTEAQLNSIAAFGESPDDFEKFGTDIAVAHTCPKCGYKWSGGK